MNWTYARTWWDGTQKVKLTIAAPQFNAETYAKIDAVIDGLERHIDDTEQQVDELYSLLDLLVNRVLSGEAPAGYLWNEEGTEVYITLAAPQADRLRVALREWSGWQ